MTKKLYFYFKRQKPFLNETIENIIKYFNTMLGSQLLYKFERLQYKKVRYKNTYNNKNKKKT